MNTDFIINRFRRFDRVRIYVLSFLWVIGLLLGYCCARSAPDASAAVIKNALIKKPTLFSIVIITVVPVAVSAISVGCRFFLLCYPLVFIGVVSRAFCGVLLFDQVGSGAWLLRFPFMFSASCASVLMWWFLFRHNSHTKPSFFKDVRFAAFCVAAIVLIDHFIFSPFIGSLSLYF